MNAKDLMIGDYVRNRHKNEIIWITEIDGDRNVINNEPDGICSERNISIKDVEPIPLTPEILKKNKFYFKTSFNQWWHYPVSVLGGSDLQLESSNDGYVLSDCSNIEVKYVHELQHLFRMAGVKKEIAL